MKKLFFTTLAVWGILAVSTSNAQDIKSSKVPAAAKASLLKKYPAAIKATWEKEKENYEANWGGKSGEDMSVTFTPAGVFVEQVAAIKPGELPAGATKYIADKYKGAKIGEAGKVTDATGKTSYEAEVKKKVLIFDEQGNFLKVE